MHTITIIGTSHISRASAREIKRTVEEKDPDVIAIELDKRRLHSLLQRQQGVQQSIPTSMIRQVGVTGYLFLVIGSWLQKKLAGIVKVQPGIDMLTAVQLAKEHKKQLLLVDQDIMVTMRNLRKNFTAREKFRMVWDVLTAPFQKEKLKVDLNKVPSAKVIKKLMGLMQDRYPGLHKALLIDRNVHMCAALDMYTRKHPDKKILLVIGAGHEEDIRSRLKNSGKWDVH